VHKDTEYRLNVCERGLEPQHRMTKDLTNNRAYADRVIAVADRFFDFDFSQVAFSGFAKEEDDYEGEPTETWPCFFVEVWRDAELYCCVEFVRIGFVGTLHVQLLGDRDPSEAFGQDIIGAVREAVNQERKVFDDFPRAIRARVLYDQLYINFDMRP